MLPIRSALFVVVFYLLMVTCLLVCWPFFFLPGRAPWRIVVGWARVSLWLQRWLAGTKVDYRGLENIPVGGVLIAAKHQSMWETFALIPVLKNPTYVLKKELLDIPVFGWCARRMGMIPVDRAGGRKAMIAMCDDARAAIARGEQVILFPEGTRRPPAAPPAYKVGVAFVYDRGQGPCVPVALNSGLFWPRRSWIRRPGTVVVEFLPAIAHGLDRGAFLARLEHDIETASDRLVGEALAARNPPPVPPDYARRLREGALQPAPATERRQPRREAP